jgi:hypothetical protein
MGTKQKCSNIYHDGVNYSPRKIPNKLQRFHVKVCNVNPLLAKYLLCIIEHCQKHLMKCILHTENNLFLTFGSYLIKFLNDVCCILQSVQHSLFYDAGAAESTVM